MPPDRMFNANLRNDGSLHSAFDSQYFYETEIVERRDKRKQEKSVVVNLHISVLLVCQALVCSLQGK